MAKKKEQVKEEVVAEEALREQISQIEPVKEEPVIVKTFQDDNEAIFTKEVERLIKERYSGNRSLAYIKLTNMIRGIYNE